MMATKDGPSRRAKHAPHSGLMATLQRSSRRGAVSSLAAMPALRCGTTPGLLLLLLLLIVVLLTAGEEASDQLARQSS